jgi:hypothetical protein
MSYRYQLRLEPCLYSSRRIRTYGSNTVHCVWEYSQRLLLATQGTAAIPHFSRVRTFRFCKVLGFASRIKTTQQQIIGNIQNILEGSKSFVCKWFIKTVPKLDEAFLFKQLKKRSRPPSKFCLKENNNKKCTNFLCWWRWSANYWQIFDFCTGSWILTIAKSDRWCTGFGNALDTLLVCIEFSFKIHFEWYFYNIHFWRVELMRMTSCVVSTPGIDNCIESFLNQLTSEHNCRF